MDFVWRGEADSAALKMAFSKGPKEAEARRAWLSRYREGADEFAIDHDALGSDREGGALSYADFVHKELVLYSLATNVRAIPHLMDGLKPVNRKILHIAFQRNPALEIKVASLAGAIIENAAYHHGEASLCETITDMAQDFVGANNINLLTPAGQFGTRNEGGKDASSPRYISTRITRVARCIFRPEDDALLTPLTDDGSPIEPAFYLPVIPMVLVNGGAGVGTGWSTKIPAHDPRAIIAILRRLIRGEIPAVKPAPSIKIEIIDGADPTKPETTADMKDTATDSKNMEHASGGATPDTQGMTATVLSTLAVSTLPAMPKLPAAGSEDGHLLRPWTRGFKGRIESMVRRGRRKRPLDS